MEKIIEFDNLSINVAWDDPLQQGSLIQVGTGDPGLAMICVELFLDQAEKRSLWYESGFTGSDDHMEIKLRKTQQQDWAGWSRQQFLTRERNKGNKDLYRQHMERVLKVGCHLVSVYHQYPLAADTEVFVLAENMSTAQITVELLLDEMGLHDLWYDKEIFSEDGIWRITIIAENAHWIGWSKYQQIALTNR